jgi:hypothetical protein
MSGTEFIHVLDILRITIMTSNARKQWQGNDGNQRRGAPVS